MQPQDTIVAFTDPTYIIQLPETITNTLPTTDLVHISDYTHDHVSQDEQIIAQTSVPECKLYHDSVHKPESLYSKTRYDFLVRHSKVNGALKTLFCHTLVNRFLYLSHYTVSVVQPGFNRMYDTLLRTFYWRDMHNDVYRTVQYCLSCAKIRGSPLQHQQHLKIFEPDGPLEFVELEILGPLPKITSGNRFFPVITDWYRKITNTGPLSKKTASATAYIFLTRWIYNFGIADVFLTVNGSNVMCKFFSTVCFALLIQQVFTSYFHPQANVQT